MATIMDDRDLMTRAQCDQRTKQMSEDLQEIKIELKTLPAKVLKEADSVYLRKDEHTVVIKALTDGLLDVKNDIKEIKNGTINRTFQIVLFVSQIVVVLLMAYIAVSK